MNDGLRRILIVVVAAAAACYVGIYEQIVALLDALQVEDCESELRTLQKKEQKS